MVNSSYTISKSPSAAGVTDVPLLLLCGNTASTGTDAAVAVAVEVEDGIDGGGDADDAPAAAAGGGGGATEACGLCCCSDFGAEPGIEVANESDLRRIANGSMVNALELRAAAAGTAAKPGEEESGVVVEGEETTAASDGAATNAGDEKKVGSRWGATTMKW